MIGGQAASAKQALVRVCSRRNWRNSKPPASRPAAARLYHSAGGGVLPALAQYGTNAHISQQGHATAAAGVKTVIAS